MKKRALNSTAATLGALLVVMAGSGVASAAIFSVDQFKITKSQDNSAPLTTLFQDDFDDGIAPPSAPNFSGGSPAEYFMTGTMGPENTGGSGRLLVDSDDSVLVDSSSRMSRARLLTNRDNSNTTSGLKANHRFEASILLDLSGLPTVRGQNIGLELSDSAPGSDPNDVLRMRIFKSNSTGNVGILFNQLDFTTNIFTTLGFVLLDQTKDQVLLTLSKRDATSSTITGSYAYLESGVAGATTDFDTTYDIFNGESFTRAAIVSVTPVPVPATFLLLGLGLAGLGIAARHRRGTA